jgi:hypothetical protein
MPKSSRVIKGEAEQIGKAVGDGTLSEKDGIQALAALVQELALNLQRLEAEVDAVKRGQSR